MLLNLVLPVVFPSWRFFSSIGPSPRIEIGFVNDHIAEPDNWLPFRPLPQKISFIPRVWRLLHNPRWNEGLYINSCAEYLFKGASVFYEQEIGMRLICAVASGERPSGENVKGLVYRIRALEFVNGELCDQVVFVSRRFVLSDFGAL